MTAQTKGVDVLETLRRIAEGEGDTEVLAMRAHAAIAELIEASRRTIRAFEALGTSNWGSEYASRIRDCEAAMVAQKEVLARATGGAQ